MKSLKIENIILIFGAIFCVSLSLLNLNKGLVFNDESYYLLHYETLGEIFSFDRTNFYRIFQFAYSKNLLQFKINTFLLSNLSIFFLFYQIARYYNIRFNAIVVGLIGVIGLILNFSASFIFQQYLGNTFLVTSSLGLIILFLRQNNFIWLTLAGFISLFILFNGNSHATILSFYFLFILLIAKSKAFIKVLIFYGLGFLLGLVVYFTFLDTLSNYINQWGFLAEYLSFHTKQHSKKFMLLWVVSVFSFVILPGILLWGLFYFTIKDKLKRKQITTYLLYFFGILCIMTKWIIFQKYFIHFLALFSLVIVIYYLFEEKLTLEQKALLIFIYFIPIFLSFGSQIWFYVRGNTYTIFYYPLIIIGILFLNNKFLKIGSFIFLLSLIINFPSFQYAKGWKKFIYKEQTEKVLINGYPHYLDKEKATKIDALKPYLKNQENIVYSNNKLLGYLYILDATPPIIYYFSLKNYITFIIEKIGKTKDDMIYFESKTYPFSKKEIQPLKYVEKPHDYNIIKVDEFTLYLPKNYKKK